MSKEINNAKELLRKEGYYIDNLWRVWDVQERYNCEDNDAYEVLDKAVSSEYIQESIFELIDNIAEDFKLKHK
tara:strand:- start:995 stop:1213 length:219 start_codon:yes stop_codon:yes gene_type:complete